MKPDWRWKGRTIAPEEKDDYAEALGTLSRGTAYRSYLKWDLGEHLSLHDLGARLTERAKQLVQGEQPYPARDAALMRAAARAMSRLQLAEIRQYGT